MTFSAFEPLEPRKLRAVDLSVASVDFPIGVLTPNEFTQVAVTVRNSGTNGQLTAFSGRVYLSANATLDGNDIQVGSFTIASLPSKTTAGVLMEMALKGKVPKGTYFGLVMIDTGLQVAESDETNNVTASFMASMTVLGTGAQPLQILGGDNADIIRISQTGAQIVVDKNGTKTGYLAGDISAFSIETGGSNDQVYVDASVVTPMFIHGGAGHDTIGGIGRTRESPRICEFASKVQPADEAEYLAERRTSRRTQLLCKRELSRIRDHALRPDPTTVSRREQEDAVLHLSKQIELSDVFDHERAVDRA